jgi:signal peptidase I
MKIGFEQFLIYKKKLKPKTEIRIISGSMEPFIFTGEYINCSPKKCEDLRPGDPVVFWRDNMLVCHFLIRSFKKGNVFFLETIGLNSKRIDPLIPEQCFFAAVTYPRVSLIRRFFFLSSIFFKRRFKLIR